MFIAGRPVISVQMTDQDVIAKVADMWGVKYHFASPQKSHHKGSWRTALTGGRAVDWMMRLRPWMGERRSGQIDRAIELFRQIQRNPKRRLLHPEQVAEIVAAVKNRTESVPALAARFGIARESAYRIARNHG